MHPPRIGSFQVERLLGSGSFATVWLAYDPDLDARVAIKVLAENWSLNDEMRARFLHEARILRRLDNDHIARVYSTGTLDNGQPYFVMEYADRGNLNDRLDGWHRAQQQPAIPEAVAIALELADCLASVHELQIVHRDLKPSNILFRSIPAHRRNRVRPVSGELTIERMLLADFGIARRLEAARSYTQVAGTPQYMAPEQGDPATAALADHRSDLYAATIILYELLALEPPFTASTYSELQVAKLSSPPPSIRSVRPDAPAGLEDFMARGLAPAQGERFQSAAEWRQALLDVVDSQPTDGSVAGSTLPSARIIPALQHPPATPGDWSASPALVPPVAPRDDILGDSIPEAGRPPVSNPPGMRPVRILHVPLYQGAIALMLLLALVTGLTWLNLRGSEREQPPTPSMPLVSTPVGDRLDALATTPFGAPASDSTTTSTQRVPTTTHTPTPAATATSPPTPTSTPTATEPPTATPTAVPTATSADGTRLLQPHACATAAHLPTRASDHETVIRFSNRSSRIIHVYWINLDREAVFYATLQPGENYEQPTYAGHAWHVVTDEPLTCLLVYFAEEYPGRAVITD
jgi:serine/threonine protein kinase